MAEMENGESVERAPHGQLGLWDAVAIIVGIVIGSSIFKTPPIIFQNVHDSWEGLGVWLVCGVLSLVGALCYAELATTYPRSGGDYVYLTRAFGRPVGFLFGWAQLVVILTGSTGMMAFIFGEYSASLFDIPNQEKAAFATWTAVGAVAALTAINFFGVILGKWVQNFLVLVKVVGLAGIVVVGLSYGNPQHLEGTLPVDKGLGLALILSTLGITLIYLAVNAAYLFSLGFSGARDYRPTIAADVFQHLGSFGGKAISILVMVSALGAMNGLIFTGSRVYSALGREHRVFALLGRWSPRFNSPVWSLLIQAAISLAMIFLVGTEDGRQGIDHIAFGLGLPPIPWQEYFGGFDTLFAGTAPVFWTFFLLTGISFFVLRIKDPAIPRPFRLRIPWYPLLPLIFCGMCVFGFYSAITYAKYVSFIGWVPLIAGLPLFFLSRVQEEENYA